MTPAAPTPTSAREPFDWANPRFTPILVERGRKLAHLRSDPRLLAGVLKHYETSPVDFIRDWTMTYDPRRRPASIPFVLFPRQVECLEWLYDHYRDRKHGLIEKSRDMGVTWLCVAFAVWMWSFVAGSKVAFGSRKESLVDNIGDPDSILEKVRVIVRELPTELQPVGYIEAKHASYLRIKNPQNGSIITGESGDQIGRGGRSSMYFIDEAAFLERPERIEASLSENTDVRIDVSTSHGRGNPFARKRFSGHFDVFTFSWRSDPRKGPDWYARKEVELDPVVKAQEVDIDYSASIEDVVIPAAWVDAAVELSEHYRYADHAKEYVRGVAGLDVGGQGTGKSVFVARFGPFVRTPVAWRAPGGDTTYTGLRTAREAVLAKVAMINFDTVGLGEGVASTLNGIDWDEAAENACDIPVLKKTKIDTRPVNVGDAPSRFVVWSDELTSRQKFANQKAEVWWLARDRFANAWEHLRWLKGDPNGVEHHLDDLIIIPTEATELKAELSLVCWKLLPTRKIAIESKEQLALRGVKSPDYAEATVLSFVPDPPSVGIGKLEGYF